MATNKTPVIPDNIDDFVHFFMKSAFKQMFFAFFEVLTRMDKELLNFRRSCGVNDSLTREIHGTFTPEEEKR